MYKYWTCEIEGNLKMRWKFAKDFYNLLNNASRLLYPRHPQRILSNDSTGWIFDRKKKSKRKMHYYDDKGGRSQPIADANDSIVIR